MECLAPGSEGGLTGRLSKEEDTSCVRVLECWLSFWVLLS
jgi:hypothetical protein